MPEVAPPRSGEVRTRVETDFQRLVSTTIAPVALSARTSRFFGAYRWVAHSDVQIGRVTNARTRATSLSSGSGQAKFVVCVQVAGRGAVVQDGRSAEIGAGDIAAYRTDAPYTLDFLTTGQRVGVVLPYSSLALSAPQLDELTGIRFSGREDPFIRAVSRSIAEYEQALRMAPPRSQGSVVDLIIASVNASLQRGDRHAETGADARWELREAALAVIDRRLADPDFDPARLAAELYVSVRTLQAAFAPTGRGVAATIRERRLDRARRVLGDPLQSHRRVTEIAAAHGFRSASHFAELVRGRYGRSPLELRELALRAREPGD